MNCKKRYIPYLIGEALCLAAELALFVFALLSKSILAMVLGAVASCVCAVVVAWITLELLRDAPTKAVGAVGKIVSSKQAAAATASSRKRTTSNAKSKKNKIKAPPLDLKSFNNIRRRVLLLSLLVAAMIALSVGALTAGILILLAKLEIISISLPVSALIGSGALLTVGLATFLLLRRSDGSLARMLDSRFALNERVQTMMAYRTREEAIYALQRRDAEAVIDRIPRRGIRIRHLWLYIVSLVLCVAVLTVSVLYTPALPPEPPREEIPFELTSIQIAAMEELIAYVGASDMESPYRENVALALSELLDELKPATTVTERDSAVGKALKNIYNETDASSSAVEIIEALWASGSDTVKALAAALNYYEWQDGAEWDDYVKALSEARVGYAHSDGAAEAPDYDTMVADITALLNADSSAIMIALTRSGVPSQDPLYSAVARLATEEGKIKGFSALAKEGATLDYASLEAAIDSTFSAFTPILYTAIEKSSQSTDTGEYAMKRVCDLFDHALPAFERPVLRDSSAESGGSGEDDAGGGMGGIGSGTVFGSDDLVLDPYTDEYVEYGTILDKYYSLMFGKTEDGDYTDEQIAALKKYFEILYGGFEDQE